MSERPENRDFVIAHLTDLHPDGGVAFAHSVAFARDGQAQLVSFNAGNGATTRPMPNTAALLQDWDDDPASVAHTAVTHTCCDDPVDTLLDGLRPMRPGLVVVGTHQWSGLSRVIHDSVSESVALQGLAPTLILPIGKPGFVDEKTGEMRLDKIVIPVGDDQEVAAAVNELSLLLSQLQLRDLDLYLLRVGEDEVPDALLTPEGPDWRWHRVSRPGKPVEGIVSVCDELDCDLVVMASRGQDGFLDVLRGTRTQQVMRQVSCALLAIPVD